jgi:hypothetical protein
MTLDGENDIIDFDSSTCRCSKRVHPDDSNSTVKVSRGELKEEERRERDATQPSRGGHFEPAPQSEIFTRHNGHAQIANDVAEARLAVVTDKGINNGLWDNEACNE